MVGELKKTYFTLLLPAVLGIVLIFLAKILELFSIPKTDSLKFVAPLIFVASVAFAVKENPSTTVFTPRFHRHQREPMNSIVLVHIERQSEAIPSFVLRH